MPEILFSYDCLIIGAGPAGLFAAEKLAEKGYHIALCDRMPSPGRKLLMAGLSGLNLTHSQPRPAFDSMYATSREKVSFWLDHFDANDLCHWAHHLGQETYIGASGRIFPKAMKASPLLRQWQKKLSELSVTWHLRHNWQDMLSDADGYQCQFMTPEGLRTYHAKTVLFATGGGSWPKLGSDGLALAKLQQFDISTHPFMPSNCGFYSDLSSDFLQKHAGKPLKTLTISFKEQNLRGSLMITQYGFEGAPLYQLSGPLRTALQKRPVIVYLDFKPHTSIEKLRQLLADKPRNSASLATYLAKTLRLKSPVSALLHHVFSKKDLANPDFLANSLKKYPLTLTKAASLEKAISSAGGVQFEAVTPHLMLKKLPGCFVAGELLDWEAPTGGYLLQACFSSAYCAANAIASYLDTSSH